MHDSKSHKSGTTFLRGCRTQLGRVFSRIKSDALNVAFSEKHELNVVGTAIMIGVGVVALPSVFTALGALAVASSALSATADDEKEQTDVPAGDPAPAGA